jgi:3-methyl-2-oxobutanoate hydroxymethyltransferase
MKGPVTIQDIQAMKHRGERFAALTAYDYTSAQIVDRAGVPLILVGDSLGMVILGHETTIPVTMDEMVHHTRATVRGAKKALVVADLPFLSYQVSAEQALTNAARMMQETGCRAVKIEGGSEIAPTLKRMVDVGMPVLGHIGYTPQSVHVLGRNRVQGRDFEHGLAMVRDALALQEAGAFAVVLELVPRQLAVEITERLHIPTIGIGSGVDCDGEIQVFHDVFGLYSDFVPRHTKRFAEIGEQIESATREYANEVRDRQFPGETQAASMEAETMSQIRAYLDQDSYGAASATPLR